MGSVLVSKTTINNGFDASVPFTGADSSFDGTAKADTSAGLVAHWNFDAGFKDVIGGNGGTPVGDVALIPGHIGTNAAYFDARFGKSRTPITESPGQRFQ